jgi:hypothetical protein
MVKGDAAPGEGERRAQRGYVAQYGAAAAAIYDALCRDDLLWVGLADRQAGAADDVVLGLPGRVVGHQFKTSQYASAFRLKSLLLGANGLLIPLIDAWRSLKASAPGSIIEVRLVTNDFPSTRDEADFGVGRHSAALAQEIDLNPQRSVSDWRVAGWGSFFEDLCGASGLAEPEFNEFFGAFRLRWGASADHILLSRLPPSDASRVREVASLLPKLVADRRDRDRWSRMELLQELGWRDSFALHREHRFPIGTYVQRNEVTEPSVPMTMRQIAQ